MSAQAAPFAVLTDIARRSRAMAAGLPEQQEAVELWNGIGFVLAGERYVAPMGEVTEILHVPRYTHTGGSSVYDGRCQRAWPPPATGRPCRLF